MAKATKKTVKSAPKKAAAKKSVKSEAKYVDGFLLPVPTKNLDAYKKISSKAGKIWREYGALEYIESTGDDLNIEGMTGFADYIKPAKGETIVFSFITYKSRAHRDSVNKKVMADPRLGAGDMSFEKMPFDMKKMAFGGFKVIVSE